jgi:hypothetical protein
MQAGVDALREDSLGRLAMTRSISQSQIHQLRILTVAGLYTLAVYYLIVGWFG